MKILILAFVFVANSAFAGNNPNVDCMRAHVTINFQDKTSREGLLEALHILASDYVRDSVRASPPAFDENTGEQNPADETLRFDFTDAFPKAVPEFKKTITQTILDAQQSLAKIPGVIVNCNQLSGPVGRMSGSF